MLEVFPQVTMWRSNFQYNGEVVAFMGHVDTRPIPGSDRDSRSDMETAVAGKNYTDVRDLMLPFDESTVTLFYSGNLTAARDLFEKYPMNTDDKPLIEYMAPLTLRTEIDGGHPLFIGDRLADFVDEVFSRCPPASDPMLANRSRANRRLPLAGAALHRAWTANAMEKRAECKEAWDTFISEWRDR
jgi:spermidine synthase